jgi:DNA-binding NtrC family response regulator
VIAATNIDIIESIESGKFREDLYYRLNTVPIHVPSLRERGDDIYLLFRKFARDFADKYRMPPIQLSPEAQLVLRNYRWPGNIRQMKNIAEQMSVIEENRDISEETLKSYLPDYQGVKLPALIKREDAASFASEREILYKILFDMRSDMNDLKKLVLDLLRKGYEGTDLEGHHAPVVEKLYQSMDAQTQPVPKPAYENQDKESHPDIQDTEEIIEESLSLAEKEIELIQKALEKYNGKRKQAARELGISERTLYRKIKEYGLT